MFCFLLVERGADVLDNGIFMTRRISRVFSAILTVLFIVAPVIQIQAAALPAMVSFVSKPVMAP